MRRAFDTILSEGSGGISGGQKQRLVIAHRLSTIKECDRIMEALKQFMKTLDNLDFTILKCKRFKMKE